MRPRSWCNWLMANRSPSLISIPVGLGTSTPTSNTVVQTPKPNSRWPPRWGGFPVGRHRVGNLLDNATIGSVAQAHGKTPAQVLIRWSIQLGNIVIPRSSSPERIAENIDVFDFELTDDEMSTLNRLDDGTRFRPDPETYTGA